MFLAGDAAHQLSPSGALGTNSGIGDAVDLGWKLGCGAERCGGEGFLFSYDVERRPIGTRNARMTTQFYLKHKKIWSQGTQIRELVIAVISAIIKKEGPVATGAAASFRRAAGSLIACGSE
jgi:2-polyprenyl-6-methoxyphenol hydroxylase-like FAD-dependent oxidoreductase